MVKICNEFLFLKILWVYCTAALNILKWKDEQGQVQTFHLADKVRVQWHRFGIILGASQNQLDEWEEQYRGNASKCWNRVMEYWLSQERVT